MRYILTLMMLKRVVCTAIVALMVAASAQADTVIFNTGKTREGEVRKDENGKIYEEDGKVFLRTPPMGEMAFDRASIKEIRLSANAGGGAVAEARAHQLAGRFKEGFDVLLKEAQATPASIPTLQKQFQEMMYALLTRARKEAQDGDNERARLSYYSLFSGLGHPASPQLMGDAKIHQQFINTARVELGNVTYKMSQDIDRNLKPKDAQQYLKESVDANPAELARRLELAELAKTNRDYQTAAQHYSDIAKAPGAPPDLVQKANFGLAAVRRAGVTPPGETPVVRFGGPTPVPTPVVIARATPPPAAAPAPTPAAEQMPSGPKWKQVLWKIEHSAAYAKIEEIGEKVIAGEGLEFIVGIPLIIVLFWVIPYYIIRAMANRGDINAANNRELAKKIGLFALIPVFASKAKTHVNTKNRCPFCNKGIDNIDAYSDLNFYTCPHCREAITPIYDMRDYIDHLIKQLEIEHKRHKGGATNAVIEKDAMLKLVRGVLTLSVRKRASDLHAEPEVEGAKVRARIDGLMYDLLQLPRTISPAFVSAIKIMANLDISEKRVPQDGKISLWIDKADVDLRVNTSPASMGEKVSIRILNQKSIQIDPTRLGLEGENLEKFERSIRKPHGLVIVTGPSGSGKSTTLYVALNEINTGEKNIVTIEDPIEYQLKGLSQMQVNTAANFTFATGLRSILRQDPDVIMVGEIRDSETAEIAIEAAMTGHLVFTTLHTIDAPTAFSRLGDLGVESRRLSSAVICVIATRLLRTVCPDCKKPYKPAKKDLETLGIAVSAKDFTFVHGAGCDNCMNTGFFGRMGIYEFLVPDDTMREILETNAAVSVIKELAKKTGYRTLRDEGVVKIMQGLTTVEEVIRVTT